MAAEVKVRANLQRALLAWGKEIPDWIEVLANECDKSTQGKVAERLGVSAAVVNQVLGKKYAGRMDQVEARVRGEFMKATVECPVLGEISTRDCIANQSRKFRPTNDLRVRLRRTCPACPNRKED